MSEKSNKQRIAETLADISINLAVIKNELEHIEDRIRKVNELEERIDKLEAFKSKVQGASVILVAIGTVVFTLGYEFIKGIM